tara:strand:- start:93829 stop:95658 length:1830 start_codon:yes stop_codon:yes gene_type:complete
MKLLENNEKALKDRFPGLLQQLNETPSTSVDFSIKTNSDFSITVHEKTIHPYGKNHGKSLIDLWVHSLELNTETCYTLNGFGLGTHIEALLANSDPSTVFFLAEQDPQWLKALFSTKDCEALLRNERFAFTFGTVDDSLMEPLHMFPLINLQEAKNLTFAPLYAFNEDYYNRFLEHFVRYFAYSKSLHATNIGDASLWQETSIKNLPYLLESPDIESMRDIFKDLPVVLISAGPSLDEAIAFLKEAQKHAVLVCVNSAYRKLTNNGITPHITLAGDPREATLAGYKGSDTSKSFLVSPCFVNHEVAKLFNGRTFTWSGKNTLVTLFRSRIGLLPGSVISEKNTISSCIADLAKLWGSKKVCLVGQDLALAADGQSHTKDSIYADREHLYLNLEDCQYLPGNTLKEVPVHKRLVDFLKAFEQVVADAPEIEFINTAENGAKIKGVAYCPYAQALDALGKASSEKAWDKLASCCGTQEKKHTTPEALQKIIQPTQQFAQRVFEICTKAALAIETLPDTFKSPNYQKHAKVAACDACATEINKLLDSHTRDYEVLYEGQTKAELFTYVKKVKEMKASTPHWERLQNNKEYFWALAQGAYFLTNKLGNTLSKT